MTDVADATTDTAVDIAAEDGERFFYTGGDTGGVRIDVDPDDGRVVLYLGIGSFDRAETAFVSQSVFLKLGPGEARYLASLLVEVADELAGQVENDRPAVVAS